MAISRRIQRLREKDRRRNCKQRVAEWRQKERDRAARDPELAALEIDARLVALGLLDPTHEIPDLQAAQEIIKQAEEVLGPQPEPPGCWDASKEIDEMGLGVTAMGRLNGLHLDLGDGVELEAGKQAVQVTRGSDSPRVDPLRVLRQRGLISLEEEIDLRHSENIRTIEVTFVDP